MQLHTMSRRALLRAGVAGAALAAGGLLLAACGGQAAPATPPTGASASPPAKPVASSASSASTSAKPAASAAGAYKPAPLAKPAKVVAGIINSASDSGMTIAADRGYFKDEGLDVQLSTFQKFADQVAPVGTGQIDVATGAINAGVFNAVARGIPLRIVADKSSTPSPEFDFLAMMVRKQLTDSGQVKDPKDLKGLRYADVSPGAWTELLTVNVLKQGGLTLKDLHTNYLRFPEMATGFANSGLDAAMVAEPYVSEISAAGTAVRWKGAYDIAGNQQVAVINFGPSMVKDKPDAAKHWMIAYLRGIRDYNDAFGPKKKDRGEIIDIIAKHSRIDPKVLDRMRPPGLNPDGKLVVGSIKRDLAYFKEAGYIKGSVDAGQVIDTTFQEYAAKVLGPYVA